MPAGPGRCGRSEPGWMDGSHGAAGASGHPPPRCGCWKLPARVLPADAARSVFTQEYQKPGWDREVRLSADKGLRSQANSAAIHPSSPTSPTEMRIPLTLAASAPAFTQEETLVLLTVGAELPPPLSAPLTTAPVPRFGDPMPPSHHGRSCSCGLLGAARRHDPPSGVRDIPNSAHPSLILGRGRDRTPGWVLGCRGSRCHCGGQRCQESGVPPLRSEHPSMG